jgi:hypothetical protein
MPAPDSSFPHVPAGHQPGPLSRDWPQRGRWGRALSGVSLSLPTTEYRRGDTIEATVTVDGGGGSDELFVGLVCTEHYLGYARADQPVIHRQTQWEQWQPLSGATSLPQPVSFSVPESEPYSHEGRILSISWEVIARRPARLRPDRWVGEPIWTAP